MRKGPKLYQGNLDESVVKVIFLSILLAICILTNASVTIAATLYMGPEESYKNLQDAMAAMSSGDTLIIRDGIYTGDKNVMDEDHQPPNGTSAAYTTIKAEHAGKVIFDGEYDRQMFALRRPGACYMRFEGIVWCRSSGTLLTMYNLTPIHHIKFIRCGAFDAGQFSSVTAVRNDGWFIGYSNHVLLEECYVFGNFRYGFYIGKAAEQIVLRRCVARVDSCNTQTGISGFTAYDARKVEFQNCIAIDINNNSNYYLANGSQTDPRGFMFRETSSGYDMSEIYLRGCIGLNINGMMIYGTSGGNVDVRIENSVFWDSKHGSRFRKTGVTVDHCTFGKIYGESGSTTYSIYVEEGSSPITNSIIYGVKNEYAVRGSGGYSAGDYNCLFNNPQGNFHPSLIPGAHTYCNENSNEIDPLDGNPGNGQVSLEYLCRIESGSDLDGKASDGGDIGATILYKIGRDGTLWGEEGYNEVTTEPLWPFPNEDLIKQQMSQYSYDADGDGKPEITGKRGFCADGQTLTKYIWEYLGNPIPPEIYGSQDNSAPHADAGQDQTVEDYDNNGSEAVTLDGSGSYDSDGSITSYTWTENGQSIASGVNPSVTLSVGTHQIQLTVTDNQGATSEDTIQVVVTPPEGDNSPPIITNVQASNTSSETVMITWLTDEPSSSRVEYGTSSNYGQTATSDDLVTTHSIALSGLQPFTTYHYRVSSTDSSGNTSNSADFIFTNSGSSVQMHTLQDFEDGVLWVAGGNQDPTGNGRGWAFLSTGDGDKIEIDNIGANGTHYSLKITFSSSNDTIYFRSDDKTRDHMPEAKGANRMSFYIRFPEGFPIQQLPFRYDTWQLGTFIHDPNDWNDTHRATSESDHGIHHYYHRFTIEKVGNGWVKYIINTHPDQANYSGSTVPPDRGSEYFDNFGRFYFHFGPEAGGPDPGRPFTIWIDEIKFYYDDGSVGGEVHDGGQDDAGFDGQFFPDSSRADTTPPTAPRNFSVE